DGFVKRSRAVEALLHDKRTTFVVVTTLEDAPLREGEQFCDELVKRDFHLGALVLNKTLPGETFGADGALAAAQLRAEAPAIAAGLTSLGDDADVDATARVLTTIGTAFENFAVVARREEELRHELRTRPDVVVDVPTYADEISDLGGLARIADHL